MSEMFNEIFGGVGSGGSGGSGGGVVLAVVSTELELNTLYPASNYDDGTIAIVDNSTERKIFFVKNGVWLWSEEFIQEQIDNKEPFVYEANNETNFNIVHNRGIQVSNITFVENGITDNNGIEYTEANDNNSLAFSLNNPFTGKIIIYF